MELSFGVYPWSGGAIVIRHPGHPDQSVHSKKKKKRRKKFDGTKMGELKDTTRKMGDKPTDLKSGEKEIEDLTRKTGDRPTDLKSGEESIRKP